MFEKNLLLMPSRSTDVTVLLKAWVGDNAALDRLTPLVYDELRRLARRQMRKERQVNTLQTTALVQEATFGWLVRRVVKVMPSLRRHVQRVALFAVLAW